MLICFPVVVGPSRLDLVQRECSVPFSRLITFRADSFVYDLQGLLAAIIVYVSIHP